MSILVRVPLTNRYPRGRLAAPSLIVPDHPIRPFQAVCLPGSYIRRDSRCERVRRIGKQRVLPCRRRPTAPTSPKFRRNLPTWRYRSRICWLLPGPNGLRLIFACRRLVHLRVVRRNRRPRLSRLVLIDWRQNLLPSGCSMKKGQRRRMRGSLGSRGDRPRRSGNLHEIRNR